MITMKLYIARDKNGKLGLYICKPIEIGGDFYVHDGHQRIDYDTSYVKGWYIDGINRNLFTEVTFENSPQEVEIALPQTRNKVWHDIDEEPIYENGVTSIIIDSNYGHISQEGHYYNQVQWKSHIEFQKHREFKWAYEKDLMNL